MARAAKRCADHPDSIFSFYAPALETLGNGQHVFTAKGMFQLGQCAQSEAKGAGLAVKNGFNFTAMCIRHPPMPP